jgi:putative ABC transport system permease protein
MKSVVDAAFSAPRFTTTLLGTFAAVALLLAAIGIYGVISYGVTQRTHEIGIRLAVGAARPDIVKLIVRGGASLALLGISAGTIAAVFLTRIMASLLYGVGTLDPVSFAAVPLMLAAIALFASWVPARRASAMDPVLALRSE